MMRKRRCAPPRLVIRGLSLLLVLFAGCHSAAPDVVPPHSKGDRLLTVRGQYGSPIRGKALAWNGLGDAPNIGGGVTNHWFLDDSLALGFGVHAVRFDPSGGAAWGAQFDASLRYYLISLDKAGVFLDFAGGYLSTLKPVPAGGTRDNWVFGFGPGVEVPIGRNLNFVGGLEFHHLSNALGRNTPRNPSQNEARSWLGIAFTW